jgi:short-subunit dehydrogenase
MNRTALITGASSGIGEAFADVFAAEGFNLVITARREDRLRALAARLEQRYDTRVEVIVTDLEQPDAPARLASALEARGLNIDVLVNNAGYGVPGSLLAKRWDVHGRFLQIMVTAIVELTYRLLPGMIDRKYGRIINVASLAGLVPAPAGAYPVRSGQGVPYQILGIAGSRSSARRRIGDGALSRIHLQRVSRRDRHSSDDE